MLELPRSSLKANCPQSRLFGHVERRHRNSVDTNAFSGLVRSNSEVRRWPTDRVTDVPGGFTRFRFIFSNSLMYLYHHAPWASGLVSHFFYANRARRGPDCRASKLCAVQNEAKASDWPGNNPAYLVIPTTVKTLLKCGDKPNAEIFCAELEASIRS